MASVNSAAAAAEGPIKSKFLNSISCFCESFRVELGTVVPLAYLIIA